MRRSRGRTYWEAHPASHSGTGGDELIPRALIVDDESDIRQVLRAALSEFGFESEEAGTGKEALARLQLAPYDLVILDLSMPGSDGFEVLEGLDELGHRPKVAVLTARTGEADRQRAYELGAIDLTTKPFDPYELVTKLTGLLQLEDEDLERRVSRDMKTSHLVNHLEDLISRQRGGAGASGASEPE